ncbi:MAG: bifunctional nuclease family protein [Propionibacterium sp.]|nr:bifunctional nuclease family protein [Propionibacterium sp.]
MIPVRIAGLALDVRSQPVVILKPVDDAVANGKVLPIWIGNLEATAILAGMEGAQLPRPLTLDLMRDMISALDATVDRIVVTKIEEGTFYAEITLTTPSGQRILDARPSDAIGLSLRTESALLVAAEVFQAAAILIQQEGEPTVDEEEAVAEFSKFLDDVDPEDFQG